jgi:Rod binding domain-containing protein
MSAISTRHNPIVDLLSVPKRLPDAKPTTGETDAAAHKQQLAKAREAAEGLVSTSFIKPILTQARESNKAPAPFGPTQAEKQFGSLLDNQLADEIVRASQFPLVDRMVEQFTRHLEAPQQIDLSA